MSLRVDMDLPLFIPGLGEFNMLKGIFEVLFMNEDFNYYSVPFKGGRAVILEGLHSLNSHFKLLFYIAFLIAALAYSL